MMRDPVYLDEAACRELARRALALSRADDARVNITSGSTMHTRFAVNQITTSGDVQNAMLAVSSAFGRHEGAATTNRFDDESLRQVVEMSERLARLAPEDPEYMGPLEPQNYLADRDAWFESTASLSAEDRAAAIRAVTDAAEARGLVSTGYLPVRAGSRAVANSRGLFAFERTAGASFSTTARTPDGTGSGWAGQGILDWDEVNIAQLAARAVEKAERSRNPQPIEPGRWTVVLEAQAAANIVGHLFGQLGARAADEGRSFFARGAAGSAIGEQILDQRVTLYSDPADPLLFTSAFTGEGLPNQRMVWFEGGRLMNLNFDRYWAQRAGRAPTGFAAGWAMQGGDATLAQMIASTERGLLVTRLWYMRSVNPRQILFTGLTRDGTFLIESGQVTRPVQNLRWNESPIHVLNNIEMIGTPERVLPAEDGGVGNSVLMPPLKVREFNFTSLSDAV